MANAFDGSDEEKQGSEGPLLEIDPELNIFALANGLDLFRNRSGRPDRVLEWYRDGMERRIVIRAEGPGRYGVTVEASRRKEGVTHTARSPLGEPVSTAELEERLRSILADGVEAANALTADDLSPEP